MIKIQENNTKKCPGETSLFVSFNYNPELVSIVKQVDGSVYDKKTTTWEVPISELSKLLNQFNSYDDIELELLKEKSDNLEDIKLPKFKTSPFPYQLDGIRYGLQKGHEQWLLTDAPGLGKSLQILYIAQELKKQKKIEHCLIICGINTLKTNWKKEVEKHTNLSCRILGERVNKKGIINYAGVKERLEDLNSRLSEFFIITNIETLRNSDIIKAINSGKNNFDMIVLDEAHCCKTPSAIQTKNFLKLNKAKYKIAATGTLLTNSPLDAYIPLKWIGKEKSNYTTFRYYYVNYGGPFNNEILGYKHTDILKEQLNKCSLRRTKDLLDLPEKNIIHEIVDMNDKQQLFYKNIVDGIVSQVDKVNITTTSLLAMVARLRQATACPSMLTTENITSSKIERCKDLIDQIVSNDEKVVIYSTFKETLNVLKNELSEYKVLLCTGDIKDNIISDNIEKFQNDDNYKIMLATWSKMGTGITLTAANNAIFIDCAWTQANNQQAEDRIHRIGSKKPVFIYYLWANNTIDMRVKELVEDKSLVANYIIDNEVPMQLVERLKQIIVDLG